MKQILCTTLLFLAFTLHALAQVGDKFDVILKTNGDEMKGKVTEILDDAVKFTYAGETTVYTVKKTEILKITFASGRVERFSDPNAAMPTPAPAATTNPPNTAAATLPTSTPEERRNKVAVLPFAFTRDGQPADEQVSMDVQDQVFGPAEQTCRRAHHPATPPHQRIAEQNRHYPRIPHELHDG